MAQPDPAWGFQLAKRVVHAKTAIWCVDVTNAGRVCDQVLAADYMCIDRAQEVWILLLLKRHHIDPAKYMLYVTTPAFGPSAFQRLVCNVRSWSNQQEYVRRSGMLRPNQGREVIFADLVFNEDEHPNVTRLALEITLLPAGPIPPNEEVFRQYSVLYPTAMLTQKHLIPGLQPAVIPADPIPAAGAGPPQHQHIPELTNNNILSVSNLSVPTQNPALALAAQNHQAVRAALSYGNPFCVETRRSQRLATRNGGSYDLFGKLP
ncbi:MAG: hypothetical protein JOS17DRAFT_762578 [Linnemannia elongata]|nr:MAG: hypothetical protein JOS17DRAFT_762578 [Linnemannia elongata]